MLDKVISFACIEYLEGGLRPLHQDRRRPAKSMPEHLRNARPVPSDTLVGNVDTGEYGFADDAGAEANQGAEHRGGRGVTLADAARGADARWRPDRPALGRGVRALGRSGRPRTVRRLRLAMAACEHSLEDAFSGFGKLGSFDSVEPIPIPPTSCPYVRLTAAAAADTAEPWHVAFEPAADWARFSKDLTGPLANLDAALAAAVPHVPEPVAQDLREVQRDVEYGRVQLFSAKSVSEYMGRLQGRRGFHRARPRQRAGRRRVRTDAGAAASVLTGRNEPRPGTLRPPDVSSVTRRLTLRRLGLDDLDELAAIFAQREVWEFPYGRGMTRAETEAFLGASSALWRAHGFGGCAAANAPAVGCIGRHRALGPDARNRTPGAGVGRLAALAGSAWGKG